MSSHYGSYFSRYRQHTASPVGVTMKATVNGEGAATFSKTPAEQVLNQIYESQNAIEGAAYGSNRESVLKAIDEHRVRADTVDKLSQRVDDACHENQSTSEEREKVRSAYSKLKDISDKKSDCLQTMVQISSMQQMCSNLSKQFDSNATEMVDLGEKDIKKLGQNIQGFIASSAQDCIFAVRDNWDWMVKNIRCIDTHMKNASAYQQFFHEVEESSVWLHEDLKKIHDSFSVTPMQGDYHDGQRLLQEIQDIIISLRQWEMKTNFVWDKATKVVPVHFRTNGVTQQTPARAIVDYTTSDFKVRDEEDLLLLDNSDAHLWKVRNARGDEGMIPSLTVLIPGPTKEAIEAAVQMRLRLLAAWTNALKVIGRRLIVFMLLVFKPDYNDGEISTMRSIKMMDRQELMRILTYVEDTLQSHWGEHEGFHNLQERILMLRMILEDAEENPIHDEEIYRSLIVQITTLEDLMKRYQELWSEWEKYKTALESSQAPELMLIVDKWEQMKFVSRDEFSKLWQHELPFTEEEKNLLRLQALQHSKAIEGFEEGALFDLLDGEEFDMLEEDFETMEESVVSSTAYGTASAMSGMNGTGGLYGAAITQELDSVNDGMFAEGVEESAFGFEEHRARGMSSEGSEFGYATETKTAQTEQLSKAEVEEIKRIVIKAVVDSRTNEEISLDDAITYGIIKADEGVYVHLNTNQSIPIEEAMNAGLIKVAFTTTKRGKEKKSSIGIITVKTERVPIKPYIIKTVKDTLTNENVNQEEGIKRGILDQNLGAFRNLKTKQECLLSTAFEEGLANIEYTGPTPEPEVICRIYAVRAVVDRRRRKIIGFQEAVALGIINKETGAYRDTSTGKDMYVGDAIMRGFLKARLLDLAKSKSMDIDPRNRVVIDATEKIKRRLIRPLSIINAMKAAAAKKRTQSGSEA